jgi:acetoin utilization protein AcuB
MNLQTRIGDRMSDYPQVIKADASVTEAAEIMEKHRIRHLPVIEKGSIIGVISERDLKQALILTDDSMGLLVQDVMTRDPYIVREGTPLSEVAGVMAEKKYGCAIIVDAEKRAIGIFTTTDGMRVLKSLLERGDLGEVKKYSAAAIERYLNGSYLFSIS